MANWQHRIENLGTIWEEYEGDLNEEGLLALGLKVAARLDKAIEEQFSDDEELREGLEEVALLFRYGFDDSDDFNDAAMRLYDFADGHYIWIGW